MILWQLPILLIARALNVFPMVAIVNAGRKPIHKMPMTQQVMMWFSGLRGALAFSLTLHIPSGAATLIKTTTLVIVFFTVLVLGGATVPMLKALKIKVRIPDPFFWRVSDRASAKIFLDSFDIE